MDRLDNANEMVRNAHDRLQQARSGEINDAAEALVSALGQVIAELREVRQRTERQRPAHVDDKPTIAPGKVRLCENCGTPCRPNPDGLCDGCHDDADAGSDEPEDDDGPDAVDE